MTRPLVLLLLLVALAAPAPAGATASTGAPDPITATVLADDQPVVRACFDAPIGSADATRFTAVDYDSAQRVAGVSVRPLDVDRPGCADVVFPDGTAVGQDSLLEFATGAAAPQSAPGAAALTGSTLAARPGATQAPDLMSAQVQAAAPSRVDYTFDEALDPGLAGAGTSTAARADPSRFGFYDAQGQFQAAQSVLAVAGATITVQFAAEVPSGVTRFVTLTGAVRDRRCAAAATLCGTASDWDASPEGQTGAAPDGLNVLLSASPDPAGAFVDLRWSAAITPAAAGTVQLFREDGRPVTDPVTITQPDPAVLRASLAEVADPDSIVLAGVDHGGTTGPSGAYGAVPVRAGRQAPGRTDGPDLTAVEQNGATITYTFDEPVAADLSQASVGVLGADGSPQFGRAGTVSGDGRTVTAALPSSAPVAAGIVPVGGLLDATGENASPLSVLSARVVTPPPAPTPTATVSAAPTVAPTVTPAATVTAGPSVKRKRRTVGAALTLLVRHNRRVSGLVVAAAPCQKHRKVITSGGGRTHTKRHGAFRVRARKLVATRIKVTVKKRVYKRGRTTIVCQRVTAKV